MRLLLASSVRNSLETGAGKWSHRVAEALRADGYDVTLWFEDDVPRWWGTGRLTVLAYPVELARQIIRQRYRFDAVIIHEPSGFWYGLARKCRHSLPPLVAMCHNVESKWFRERIRAARRGLARLPRSTRVKSPLFRIWQSDGAIRLADHVVCLSSEDRNYIIGTLARRPHEVTQIANGAAAEDFVTPAGRQRGMRVLFVGGWLDVKGARLLPIVFRKVRERLPDVQLTIAGSGVPPAAVAAEFDHTDRPHVMVLAGALDGRSLRELYRSHDAFFMPSLSEGSPLSLIEAMAAGCPIVAAAVGGIPDIIQDGIDGFLFESMNAGEATEKVVRLLSDSPLAETFGRTARQRALALTWNATARGVASAAAATIGNGTGAVCPKTSV